jgi:iron complex outermembrane receptor protein
MELSVRRARLHLLGGAAMAGSLLFVMGGVAQAQEAPAPPADDEIVVTGFRASLQRSADIKRNNSSIVEAITAEDIGRLPDNSIAEALARLPGLTAQRLFGRAQVVSVRGLSPDFTTALLNGREQVSAGDNRGVEFDQYPSELLSSVLVYKTPDASLIGQGLAGTADLRTVRPIQAPERAFAVGARYEWNELDALVSGQENNGYRFTLSYIDRTEDHRWGWAFGAAVNSSPTQAERWDAWGYPTVSPGVLVLGGAKPYVQSSTLERQGYMGVIQFAPSDTFTTTLDMFYSDFQEEQNLRGIELPLYWSAAQLQPGYTVANGLVTEGVFANVEGVVRSDLRSRDSIVKAVGWNTEFNLSNGWTFSTDLGYSSVERTDVDLEEYAGTGPGVGVGAADTLAFHQGGGGGFVFDPQLDYADTSLILLTNPQGWSTPGLGQAGFIKTQPIEDELKSLRLSAEHEMDGFLSGVEFGVNYSERDKSKASIENFVDLIGGNFQSVPIPSQFLGAPTALAFLGIPAVASWDPLALLNSGDVYELRPLSGNNDVNRKNWSVEEKVTVFYLQFNLATELADLPLTGNFGMQIVKTDQSSTGGVNTPAGLQTVTVGDRYTEFLPSLNLTLELTDDMFIRFGAARTLARARMDDLRASFTVNWNQAQINNPDPFHSYWGGNGGNPKLRPWIADSFDLSWEWYFHHAGYVSAAAYYKNLQSYIFRQNALFDFSGFPTFCPGDQPVTNLGIADTPQNGTGGYIRGLEFTVSIPGEIVGSFLEGFGLLVNASFTESDIQQNPNDPSQPLPGLSDRVINSTVYYERGGFEARVSNRYRTDFLGEVIGFGADRVFRNVNGESVIDAQIGYRFQDGPMRGLSILLQGNNLTDEPFGSYFGNDTRQVQDYQHYGSTYLFGLNYRR